MMKIEVDYLKDRMFKFLNKFDNTIPYQLLLEEIKDIRIESHSSVETASIQKTSRGYVIFINKYFLKYKIKDENDLLFVLLHEFAHHLNGDFYRETAKDEIVSNIACDLIINRYLIENFFPTPPQILKRLYFPKKENLNTVMMLLCPPAFLSKSEREIEKISRETLLDFLYTQRAFIDIYSATLKQEEKVPIISKQMAKLYSYIWFKDVSYLYLVRLLETFIKKYENLLSISLSLGYRVFLGSHKPVKIKMRVYNYTPDTKWFARIRKALVPSWQEQSKIMDLYPDKSIIPSFDRKSSFLLSGGYYPSIFKNYLFREQFEPYKIHLYIDASPSMWEILPVVIGFIKYFKDLLGSQIYAFSNCVFPVKKSQIIRGEFLTTFGTDFEVVAEHALRNGFKKIFIITDSRGYPGRKWDELRKNCLVYGIITEERFSNLWDKSEKEKYFWILDKEKIKMYNLEYGGNSKRKINNPENNFRRKRIFQGHNDLSGAKINGEIY